MSARIGAQSLARLLPESWPQSVPRYVALADSVRLLVLDGRVPLDVRLPSERELATGLATSRTTVTAAYERLRGQGFLVSRQGAGSWTAVPGGAVTVSADGGVIRPMAAGELPDGTIDLATASFPAGPEVPAAFAAAGAVLPRHLSQTGYTTTGLPVLREAIAAWYCRRGLPTTADDVVVTSGSLQAISLALGALVAPGDRVLVDHPSYPNALEAIRRQGARPVPVAVDGPLDRHAEPGGRGEAGPVPAGWDLDAVAATLRQSSPVVGYVVPDFHNPTGTCLDLEERRRFAALAATSRTTLVVDESLTELWFDDAPPPPMAALAPGPVVSVGGLAKSVWGGLRVGWVRAERSVLRRIVSARSACDCGNPVVEQLAAAHLLTDPSAGEAVAHRRRVLRRLRDETTAALAHHAPGWRWHRPLGGMSLWVQLDAPVSSAMAAAAGRHGLRLAPGPLFGLNGAFDRHLRVPLLPFPAGAAVVASRLAALRADPAVQPGGAGWDVPSVA